MTATAERFEAALPEAARPSSLRAWILPAVLDGQEGAHEPREDGRLWSWFPALGVGYLTLHPATPYGLEYWLRYQRYRGTLMEAALNRQRARLVKRALGRRRAPVLDVGIGNGSFLEVMWSDRRRRGSVGYDVCPQGVEWLRERGAYREPWSPHSGEPCVTMWDVIEHLPEPGAILEGREAVCISTPIYSSEDHARTSKHHKPGEHCWYFTASGLRWLMRRYGFRESWSGRPETLAGRESIGSFVFTRVTD